MATRMDKWMVAQAGHPWQLAVGLCIWALWFLAVYVGVSVACAVVPPPAALGPFNAVSAALILLTAATALGLAWAALASLRALRRMAPEAGTSKPGGQRLFIARASAVLYGIAAFATVFVGLPLIALPPCV